MDSPAMEATPAMENAIVQALCSPRSGGSSPRRVNAAAAADSSNASPSNATALLAEPSTITTDRGLVNCQFSVNQPALYGMLRPMVSEMLQEVQHGERLKALETGAAKSRLELEQKASAKDMRECSAMVRQHQQMLLQKADQKQFLDLQGLVGRLDETIAWKADRAALDEVAATLERTSQLAGQKADLSYVNRTNAMMTKMQGTLSKVEKMANDSALAIDQMEALKFQQVLNRTRDHLDKMSKAFKTLQDVVANKVDKTTLDEVLNTVHELDQGLDRAASQQAMLELQAVVGDFQRQMNLKADNMTVEDHRQELHQLSAIMPEKASDQDVRHASASLKNVHQGLLQKADSHLVDDLKSRLTTLELLVTSKADRRELGEVHGTVDTFKEESSRLRQADHQMVSELARKLCNVDIELKTKAEAQFLRETGIELEKLKELTGSKADHAALSRRLGEVEHQFTTFPEQLRSKADHQALQDTAAQVKALHTEFGGGAPRSPVLSPRGLGNVLSPNSSRASTATANTTTGSCERLSPTARSSFSRSASAAGSGYGPKAPTQPISHR